MSINKIPVRSLIYYILLDFEQKKTRLDQLFTQILQKHRLSDKEKRFMRQIVSGTVRHLKYLDWQAARLYKGQYKKVLKKTKSLLRAALFEIIFLDYIPAHATVNEYVNITKKVAGLTQSKVVNALLRNYLRLPVTPDPEKEINNNIERIAIQYSFPKWIIIRWINLWGQAETIKLCQNLNKTPDFDVRVNEELISPSALLTELTKAGIRAELSTTNKQYLKISEMQEFITGGWVDNAYCTVQDESAGIPVELLELKKDDWFLDICSAPGGKFTQALEKGLGNGQAVAIDSDLKRLNKVRHNSNRYNDKKAQYIVADGKFLPFKIKFNKILLDAPCSGLGVIRKHPDIKWRREFKDIIEFSDQQYGLLQEAVKFLDKRGRIVYSTCTIDPLENEDVINRFLDNNTQITVDHIPAMFSKLVTKGMIKTYPHRQYMDGSFSIPLKYRIKEE